MRGKERAIDEREREIERERDGEEDDERDRERDGEEDDETCTTNDVIWRLSTLPILMCTEIEVTMKTVTCRET